MDDLDRYYAILGLKPGSSPEEIREAYRNLVNVWHPDRFLANARLQEKATEKLREINTAYEELRSHIPGTQPGSDDKYDFHSKYEPKTAPSYTYRPPPKQAETSQTGTGSPLLHLGRYLLKLRGHIIAWGILLVIGVLIGSYWGQRQAASPQEAITNGSFQPRKSDIPPPEGQEPVEEKIEESVSEVRSSERSDPGKAQRSSKTPIAEKDTVVQAPVSESEAQSRAHTVSRDNPKNDLTIGSTKEEELAVQGTSDRFGDTFLEGNTDSLVDETLEEEKEPEGSAAYELLKGKSGIVQRLSANSLSNYVFKEWKTVKSDYPEFWIELLASQRIDSQENLVRLTWSVDVETGLVCPLSQAARDLVFQSRGP
ncbi:J domain-containing protein [Acidobacteria bacterium AH-259-O06]|nr:J domain-containing protein [Acidobacteria bacterium AH-259-O06]